MSLLSYLARPTPLTASIFTFGHISPGFRIGIIPGAIRVSCFDKNKLFRLFCAI